MPWRTGASNAGSCRKRFRQPKSGVGFGAFAPLKPRRSSAVLTWSWKGCPLTARRSAALAARRAGSVLEPVGVRALLCLRGRAPEAVRPAGECGEATFVEARHWPRLRGAARRAVVFGIVEHEGKVKAKATRARCSMEVWLDIAPVTTPGAPHYVDTRHAYVWLPVQGERVVIPKGRRPRKRTATGDKVERPGTPEEPQPTERRHACDTIERFGNYFEERLKHFRSVPLKDFHLYVGDVCFRFNSRHKELKRKLLIMQLMKRYSPEQLHGVWSG